VQLEATAARGAMPANSKIRSAPGFQPDCAWETAFLESFRKRDFSFQISRRGRICFSSNGLQGTAAGKQTISTALTATLRRHGIEFHDRNLPSRSAWRKVQGVAEASPSRRSKAITTSAFFSLPDVASCSALLTSPQFLHGRRVRAEDGATISGRTVSHYRILEKLGGGGDGCGHRASAFSPYSTQPSNNATMTR